MKGKWWSVVSIVAATRSGSLLERKFSFAVPRTPERRPAPTKVDMLSTSEAVLLGRRAVQACCP